MSMKLYDKIRSGGVYFIAEMSANHAGSLENALEIVRAAGRAGADCVKLQTYTADTMTIDCDSTYFRITGGLWNGNTLYELYRKGQTPWKWHKPIRKQAEKLGMDFLSTPFDRSAVDFLEDLGAEAYKISSFEITDIPLIEYAAGKGKPMIISAGMAEKDEIARAVEAVRGQGNEDVILLKCTSEYPAKAEDMNLAAIPDMAGSFGLPVGLSDHSLGGGAAVAAVLLGAVVIEKHFCLSREIKSPDSDFSMEPEEFLRMAEDVRRAAAMRGGVRYGPVGDELSSLRFRRSIFAVRDIRAGETFTEENVRVIRPCYGLAPACYPAVLGTACKRELKRGDPVTEDAVCVKLK